MSNGTKRPDYSHLSIPEGILLAQELWESVYDHAAQFPLTDVQRQEIEQRWGAFEAGNMTASTWPEVKLRLAEK
jgi:putative addiction module component (TIGR02574 family)